MSRISRNRKLSVESLELRSLMAADLHNLFSPLDVNDDSKVSPSDALAIINQLNTGDRSVRDSIKDFVDVTDDGVITPSDALQVINWLNVRDPSVTSPGSEWVKVDGAGEARVGVKMHRAEDGSVTLEVIVQNGPTNSSREVTLEDKWIGTIATDRRGRGEFKLDSSTDDLSSRLSELILNSNASSKLEVDSLAEISIVDDSERSGDNLWHGVGNILTATLQQDGERRGEVTFYRRDAFALLAVYVPSGTAGQEYELKIDGTLVANLVANDEGVIAQKIEVDQTGIFPDFQIGSIAQLGQLTGEFQAITNQSPPLVPELPETPPVQPQTFYHASLDNDTLIGRVFAAVSANQNQFKLVLIGVDSGAKFDLLINNIKIAEVTANADGIIEFHYDSSEGSVLLAEFPTLAEDTEVAVAGVISGRLTKLGDH